MIPEVTTYVAKLPLWQTAIAEDLRRAVHEADPEIKEAIKWGSPAFEHAGIVCWMFATKEWIHFSFPQGKLLDHQHGLFEELPNDPNSKAKRTIKLKQDVVVPTDVIKQLVKQAASNNLSGNKVLKDNGTKQDIKLPPDVEKELNISGKSEAFYRRPYYQQKGYLLWLDAAKKPETRLSRLKTMCQELSDGRYMPPNRERS